MNTAFVFHYFFREIRSLSILSIVDDLEEDELQKNDIK
jgi:hypothetical protein